LQGNRIGYVRVSSFDQNPERQLELIQVDKVFTDKASGKDTQRPQLDALLGFVREGDTVAVHSMDRLARNLDDLRRLVLIYLVGQQKRYMCGQHFGCCLRHAALLFDAD